MFHHNPSTDSRPWRLLLSAAVWAALVRSNVNGGEKTVVSPLRFHQTALERLLIAEQCEVVDVIPQGSSLPAIADNVLLSLTSTDRPVSPQELLAMARPCRSQLLSVVAINAAGNWDGIVWRSVAEAPLNELVIAGPRPLVLRRNEAASHADVEARWSRTAGVLGRDATAQLRGMTVTQVGAGRLGTLMAWQWAALGVGHLRLIDGDDLSVENLDAMPGITARSVGDRKVLALGRELRRFRPDIQLTLLPKRVNSRAGSDLLFARTDLLVTAVDSDTARLAAAVIARESLTPHLDIAASIQPGSDGLPLLSGDVRLCLPMEGCCACVGGLADFREAVYELLAPDGALPRRRRPAWNVERMGSLMSWNSTLAGVAMQSWLDLITGRWTGSLWRRLAWDSQQGVRTDSARVTTDPQCRVCHRLPLRGDTVI